MRNTCLLLLVCLPLSACRLAGEAAAAPAADELTYRLHYELVLEPLRGVAQASITLEQPRHLLREARFNLSGERWTEFAGDGEIERRGDKLVWRPPEAGGTLRWQAALVHPRGEAYDARLGPGWALFRGEDAFPAAATRTLKDAVSRSTLSLRVPRGWSVVTPYREEDGRYLVVNDERRFDRPTGWMVAGNIGVRRDTIAGVRVAVAGPVDQGVRRVDVLALLNWNLPAIVRLVPDFPDRLTVVSAGDPMWRGALSAPDSLYVHAERPLISENGTSTLLHELMHIALGRDTGRGDDWILEGLAEYYSVEVLRRTGTVTSERSRDTFRDLAEWGRESEGLRRRHSTGATTARAVSVFRELDREIRDRTAGDASLDDVFRRLAEGGGHIDLDELRETAAAVIGASSRTLASKQFRDALGEPAT
ncbi:hypothetical protein [Lentisalinibacter sediminis]|uniref:hypothetical protein n=1 Tax=Lentisalinibacter sediminis TaxID=2992237 RepID=UPI00386A71AD